MAVFSTALPCSQFEPVVTVDTFTSVLLLPRFVMHEIGIAAVILERVRLFTKEHNHSRVTRVGIRLGGLSGVDPDALTFGFEV
jgi:hypothetical protein